ASLPALPLCPALPAAPEVPPAPAPPDALPALPPGPAPPGCVLEPELPADPPGSPDEGDCGSPHEARSTASVARASAFFMAIDDRTEAGASGHHFGARRLTVSRRSAPTDWPTRACALATGRRWTPWRGCRSRAAGSRRAH